MDRPIISVVIPVFNAEPYLRRCLDSVVNQTFKEIEIICVDDGSTDHSFQILKEYQLVDGRIQLVQQRNQYAGIARNNGMALARGKYIIFWDADDYFQEEALQELYNNAERTSADISVCDADAWDAELDKKMDSFSVINFDYMPDQYVFSRIDVPNTIFQIFTPCPWNKLFRLDFLKNKNIRFPGIRDAEDVPFTYIALAEAERISVLGKKLVRYTRYLSSSLESTKANSWENILKAGDILYHELSMRGKLDLLHQSFDNWLVGNITRTFSILNQYQSFCNLFLKYKNVTIPKYALDNHAPSYFYDKDVLEKFEMVQHCLPEEYLLCEVNNFQKRLDRIDNRLFLSEKCKSWIIPEEGIPRNSKVILYGAGDVGKDFYRQIRKERVCDLVGWVDKKGEYYRKQGLPVENISFIYDHDYDFILVSVLEEEIAKRIREDLLMHNIPSEKILWVNLSEAQWEKRTGEAKKRRQL